jgi:3-oxoacyl-[acyl-carrier-protein] synthase-3
MSIGISAIEYYLPEKIIDNDTFEYAKNEFLEQKVGIKERRMAAADETTCDMAVKAVNALINKHNIKRDELEFLVLCSVSPDYILPQVSSMLQHYCELPESIYSIDIRMGCTGFVHALSIAQSLIAGMGYRKGLVVTADKFTSFLSYRDFSVDTLFSDSATAILVEEDPRLFEIICHDFGTEGSSYKQIIIEAGGCKLPHSEETAKFEHIKPGIERSKNHLYMNGRQVMKFANRRVPTSINKLLEKSGVSRDDIDWLVLHQANKLMLQDIAGRSEIPDEKNYINLWNKGNTVASSIPIAVKEILDKGERLDNGRYWLLSGFGLGLVWGTTLVRYVGDSSSGM